MRNLLKLAVFVTFAFPIVAEEKKDDKPERITYRVTGLFSADREKDLREGFKEIADITLVAVDFEGAEITVEFSPAKLFPGQKPERVAELVNDKVRQATHHTFGVKPRS